MSQKPNNTIFFGLDVGSSEVRCLIGRLEEETQTPAIIGVGSSPVSGVRKGVVVDIEETVSAISAAVEEAERIAGIGVDHATIGVNGSHISTLGSQGIIAVGGGREITIDDVARVEEAAATVQLPPNREIIQLFAREYSIDGQENIKDPLGMSGMRLEAETRLVTAATPSLRNLERTLGQAGIGVDNYVINPIAAATAVLSRRQRELGCVLLDMGAATTGLAIYEEGELLHAAVIPVGASHITNDLAIGLRTDIDTAEAVKREHAVTDLKPQAGGTTTIKIKGPGGDDSLTIDKREVANIATARLEEIFELARAQINRVKPDGRLPAGAVMVGGGANIEGVEELARDQLGLPATIGQLSGFSGVVDKLSDPTYVTPVGLMLENMEVDKTTGLFDVSLTAIKQLASAIRHRFKS